MSEPSDRPTPSRAPPSPFSWPPPGLERLQGKLWRAIAISWVGAVVLVLPLLWSLATERPFWSLGPFEGEWRVGLTLATAGMAVVLVAFGSLFSVLRAAWAAAEAGYGTLTILEVASDVWRDMGFLVQGRRHFGALDAAYRTRIIRARLRGSVLALAAGLWLATGFGVAVLLAARGFLTPSGLWLVATGPAALMLALALGNLVVQGAQVRSARQSWAGQEGGERIRAESAAWIERLDAAGELAALGSGRKGEAARFRAGAALAVVACVVALVPAAMVAMTGAIGPILADIAVPRFLSVQEMAGAAEVYRRFRLDPAQGVRPADAGFALQNLAFVGTTAAPDPLERKPVSRHAEPWFPEPDVFPDPFAETAATDLMSRPLTGFTPEERAALRQAAAHPAHAELDVLARAPLIDVASGRWTLPFPDTLNFLSLPWPRFAAFRTAGLARVARAAVELADGDPDAAEETLRELVSAGFLLIDEGPTLIDNLMGVVLANMGGDALIALYGRTGRTADARALSWARDGARAAAGKARAGLVPEDVHSLLQGTPDLVVDEAPLRGLRWEYFANFNLLAPCINAHKMVFGPDRTYEEWRLDARDALVRVRGEVELFDLAERISSASAAEVGDGLVARLVRLTLGGSGAPGSCAALLGSLGTVQVVGP